MFSLHTATHCPHSFTTLFQLLPSLVQSLLTSFPSFTCYLYSPTPFFHSVCHSFSQCESLHHSDILSIITKAFTHSLHSFHLLIPFNNFLYSLHWLLHWLLLLFYSFPLLAHFPHLLTESLTPFTHSLSLLTQSILNPYHSLITWTNFLQRSFTAFNRSLTFFNPSMSLLTQPPLHALCQIISLTYSLIPFTHLLTPFIHSFPSVIYSLQSLLSFFHSFT